ncbi:MAG: hypothetical protein K1X64_20060 [Myxococcaceae bacterium]|nr:hypothetical protein [Myxococcaceae bacterium]
MSEVFATRYWLSQRRFFARARGNFFVGPYQRLFISGALLSSVHHCHRSVTKGDKDMLKKLLGLGAAVCFASAIAACGGGNLSDNWVGVYTGTDTYVLSDGGSRADMFEVNVSAAGASSVSVGGVHDNGLVFDPFVLLVSTDGTSASRECVMSVPGVQCSASLQDKKTLVLNGKDCATQVTFSVSVTKK